MDIGPGGTTIRDGEGVPAEADVVIVGAGPAGLAAAAACSSAGLRPIVLERGKGAIDRDRRGAEDIGSGVGGAGLFSDGKFSFHPSATKLWMLQPEEALRVAYGWTSSLIMRFGIEAPPFPDLGTELSTIVTEDGGGFHNKQYPSFRMNLEKRLQLVNALGASAGKIYTGVEVARIHAENNKVVVTTRTPLRGAAHDRDVVTKCAVIATGRLGAIRLLGWMSAADFVFRRIEVGVRLEQQQDSFFLRESRDLDPKLIGDDGRPNVQWRTFCCCRGGEVIEVLSDGILAVAGRSDIEPTGLSNVAFHLRMTDPVIGNDVCVRLLSGLEQHPQAFSLSVEGIRTDAKLKPALVGVFGSDAASELFSGLCRLADQFAIQGPVTIHGPSVEGVGWYPNVNERLRMARYPIWVPGDVAGIFRGLTAALVSGYFAGMQVIDYRCN